jgi:SapC protein
VNLAALDAKEHATVRLRAVLPEIPHFVEILAGEFAAASAVCPIFLAKNPETGAFYAAALFGFKPGENLLAGPGDRPPPYVPLDQQRAGFYVSGEHIAIDLDNPRFALSGKDGEPLFEDDGQPGPMLRQIQRKLGQLVQGKRETEAFVARLLDLKLVEPIDISLRFDDGEELVLDGLYTASLDALRELDDGEVLTLFRTGHLQLIYSMTGSLKQIGVLAERRNRMLAGNL